MRLKAAAAFALLAAAAAPAIAKPPAGAEDSDRMMYRLQAVGACVAAHPPGRSHDPQDSRIVADCECAVDRFIAGRDVADLPRLIPGQDKGLLDEPFAQCRAGRTGTSPAPAPATPGSADAEAAEPGAEPGAEPASAAGDNEGDKSPGFDPLAWFSGFGLPGRAWWPIPAFAVALLLFVLLRRRRRSDDLLGPPRSMRSNARPGPRSTWPIDDR